MIQSTHSSITFFFFKLKNLTNFTAKDGNIKIKLSKTYLFPFLADLGNFRLTQSFETTDDNDQTTDQTTKQFSSGAKWIILAAGSFVVFTNCYD